MQNQPRILIVLPEAEVAAVRKHIAESSAIGAETIVEILPFNCKPAVSKRREAYAMNGHRIAERLAETDFQYIIVDRRVPLAAGEFSGHNYRITNSLTTLLRETSTVLKELGLHWMPYARKEWEKSALQHVSPEAWVEQFARLGHRDIARRLLKSLRVIEDASLQRSFYTRKEEMLGLRVGHGFFFDDEKGSSSIVIQQVLEHMYVGKVHKLQIEDAATWASLDLDRLYIYEDGLWSGVELLRRLKSIAESPAFQQSDIHFYFKFSATTDVGLTAARLLTRKLKTSRFHFIAGDTGNHFEFFRRDADTNFLALPADDAALRTFLDGLVEPYAFKDREIWNDARDQAISICEEIGRQLITPFLARKQEEKNAERGENKMGEGPDISGEKAKRWQLGAMNFASTVVFSSSIPKPVLPLMWLNGPVQIGKLNVDWRPLFWDVRRTGVYDQGGASRSR